MGTRPYRTFIFHYRDKSILQLIDEKTPNVHLVEMLQALLLMPRSRPPTPKPAGSGVKRSASQMLEDALTDDEEEVAVRPLLARFDALLTTY